MSSRDALTETEALELAARMLDAQDEAAFDHLLATAMTHAAARSGVILSPELGRALGGMLKKIARRCLSDPVGASALGLELEGLNELESEFETNLRLVRLTGEAARQAAEEFFLETPDRAAVAALAAAANLYAPPLVAGRALGKRSGRANGKANSAARRKPSNTIRKWNTFSAA